MIGWLQRLFVREVPREVAQAATVLLMLPSPGDAYVRAGRNAGDAYSAGDHAEAEFWFEVRGEIVDRTGYRREADVGTRYSEGR